MDDRNLEDWRLNPPDYEEIPEEPDAEPCPFCGSEPELDYSPSWNEWTVACSNVDCWLSEPGFTSVENWNKRNGKESEGE